MLEDSEKPDFLHEVIEKIKLYFINDNIKDKEK